MATAAGAEKPRSGAAISKNHVETVAICVIHAGNQSMGRRCQMGCCSDNHTASRVPNGIQVGEELLGFDGVLAGAVVYTGSTPMLKDSQG